MEVPRYYRLQLVFSDRDADLKRWFIENPSRTGSAVREAMRQWLASHGETLDASPVEAKPRERRRSPAPPATRHDAGTPSTAVARKSAAPIATPPPAPAPNVATPAVAATPPPPSPSPSPDTVITPPTATKTVDLDRLKRLLGGNREFV